MGTSDRLGIRYLTAWHLLALALLAGSPALLLKTPVWALTPKELNPLVILLAGYSVCAAFAVINRARGRATTLTQLLLSIMGVFGLIFLYLLLTKQEASRAVMLAVFTGALLLVPLSLHLQRTRALAIAVLAAAALGVVATSLVLRHSAASAKQLKPAKESSIIKTAFYNVHETAYKNYIPEPAVRGGGLTRIGDRLLLGTGDGYLYLLNWIAKSDALNVLKLPYRVPINGDEFAADTTGQPWHRPLPTDARSAVTEDSGDQIINWWFRVVGVLVQDQGDNLRVFASHYYWKRDQSCWVERVSLMEGARGAFLSGDSKLSWRTVFETHPCLPVKGAGSRRGTPFAGHFGGGRMVSLDADTILLSVGDFGFNGVASNRMLAQDPSTSYGKTILIHVKDGRSETYTTGHRNPEGLYLDPHGAVWETEQGPQGGDELNVLKQGLNYGWPLATYGTDYGTFEWPLNPQQGEHNGFEPPMYAWLPDIGVSDVIGVEKDIFPIWRGDLLVASLTGRSVFRIRIRNQRVAYVESMLIDMGIRDIVEATDGKIVLWADDADTIVTLQPAVGSSGEILFSTNCSGCHKIADGTSHRIGPDLWGVVGRKIASAGGYVDYSAALRALGGKWDEERLDAFIKNPQAAAPGTAMEFGGVADAATRTKIIDYIKHADKTIPH
jgi:cytochrome c2